MTVSIRAAAAAAGLLCAGLATPAIAQPVNQLQSQQPAANAPQADQRTERPRRICVRMELTNSRMPRTVCRTAEEWNREGGVPTQDN